MNSPEHDEEPTCGESPEPEQREPIVEVGVEAFPVPPPVRRGPGPYSKVILYLVGYFVVGLAVSIFFAVIAGTLIGFGVIDSTALDSITPTMNIEEIVEAISPYLFPIAIITGLYTILYTWAFMRIVDRKPFLSLGLYFKRGWASDFAKGAVLALLILAVIFTFSIAVDQVRVEGLARPAPEGTPIALYLLGALVAFFVVGLYEEVMFRGYILQRLSERASKVVATIISSIVFAVLHGANPGADAFGVFNTTIIGVILCVLYFRTRSLWMPVGFHFAWNFSLGYLYSLPVSGLPIYGVLNVVEVDPDSRLTGGSYGPEAGLACTVALAIWGGWLIWKRTGRRKEEEGT